VLRYRFLIPACEKADTVAGIQIGMTDADVIELAIQIARGADQEITVRLQKCLVCELVVPEGQRFCSPQHRTQWHNTRRRKT